MSTWNSYQLTLLARLIEEASGVISSIPCEVLDKLEVRHHLCDELIGSAIMLRDEKLQEEMQAQKKAKLWDDLMHLCGHWQDGSSQTVKFYDDDATRTCHVKVNDKHYFYGDSFESAMRDAILRFPREDEEL